MKTSINFRLRKAPALFILLAVVCTLVAGGIGTLLVPPSFSVAPPIAVIGRVILKQIVPAAPEISTPILVLQICTSVEDHQRAFSLERPHKLCYTRV